MLELKLIWSSNSKESKIKSFDDDCNLTDQDFVVFCFKNTCLVFMIYIFKMQYY